MKSRKEAILLLTHGSSEKFAKKNILSLKKRLANMFQDKQHVFYHAFLEFNTPMLLKSLYSIGGNKKLKISKVTILPIFISDGNHTLYDLPEIIKTFRKTYKHINIRVAKPLGNDDLVVRLLYKRYNQSLHRK